MHRFTDLWLYALGWFSLIVGSVRHVIFVCDRQSYMHHQPLAAACFRQAVQAHPAAHAFKIHQSFAPEGIGSRDRVLSCRCLAANLQDRSCGGQAHGAVEAMGAPFLSSDIAGARCFSLCDVQRSVPCRTAQRALIGAQSAALSDAPAAPARRSAPWPERRSDPRRCDGRRRTRRCSGREWRPAQGCGRNRVG